MSSVKDYMVRTMNSITPDDSIRKAIIIMYRSEQSVLPVVDHQNLFVGTIYSNNILKNIPLSQTRFVEIVSFLFDTISIKIEILGNQFYFTL